LHSLTRWLVGSSHSLGMCVAALYVNLTLLLVFQFVQPGSFVRISDDVAGGALLGAGCVVLTAYALQLVAAWLLGFESRGRAPGLADASLHAAVGLLGLWGLIGKGSWAQPAQLLVLGCAGGAVAIAGVLHAVFGLRVARGAGGFEPQPSRHARSRSRALRSGVLVTLGVCAFMVALRAGKGTEVAVLGPGLLVVCALAFALYAFDLLGASNASEG